MKKDFIEVFCCDLLNYIKKAVQKKIKLEEVNYNNLNCNSNRIEKIDEKMLAILNDLYLTGDSSPAFSVEFGSLKKHKKINKQLKKHLVLYYTALYFDNVELLKELLKDGFSFGKKPNDLLLCVLDPEISSAFDISIYKKILGKIPDVFESFYDSIMNESYEDRKKYIKKFASILKKRDDFNFDERWRGFRKHSLDIFDVETYLQANASQFYIIGTIGKFENPENIKRLNKMMQEKGFVATFLQDGEYLFDFFDDDEIEELDEYNGMVLSGTIRYSDFYGIEPTRLKNLYSINKNLINYKIIYNKRFLETFDDKTIATFPEGLLADFSRNSNDLFPEDEEKFNNFRIMTKLQMYGVVLDNFKPKGISQKVKLLLGVNNGK